MIGRQDTRYFGQRERERSWWIGKPWRRIELTVFGEGEYREWQLSFSLGVRRFGWKVNGSLVRSWNDYFDEPNQ